MPIISIQDESEAFQIEWLTFADIKGWKIIGNWVSIDE